MRHPHRAPGGRRQFLTRLTRLAGGVVAGAALIRPSAAAWKPPCREPAQGSAWRKIIKQNLKIGLNGLSPGVTLRRMARDGVRLSFS